MLLIVVDDAGADVGAGSGGEGVEVECAREGYTARACIGMRFAREVPCTISPLQTTKGHTQAITIINIVRHKNKESCRPTAIH